MVGLQVINYCWLIYIFWFATEEQIMTCVVKNKWKRGGWRGQGAFFIACSTCGWSLLRSSLPEIRALTGTALVRGILWPLLPYQVLTASLLTLLYHHPHRCLSNQGKILQLYHVLLLSIKMILRAVQKSGWLKTKIILNNWEKNGMRQMGKILASRFFWQGINIHSL